MSRIIIRDIVIPIVSKIMNENGYAPSHRFFEIRDESLEEFLEEAMRRHFGVSGANECQHLREQLVEAKRNDPYAFEFLVRRLLEKYVKLEAEIRHSKEQEIHEIGPPDRFTELRKSYPRYCQPEV